MYVRVPLLCSTEQLAAIPKFAGIGQLFKSSDKPTELTESETEYVVRCVKHCFQNYMVFQVMEGGRRERERERERERGREREGGREGEADLF